MIKPFDSKVEFVRDDDAPLLEFKYKGAKMSEGEMVASILAFSFVITAPLAAIPIIRSRRSRTHIHLDKEALSVNGERYVKEHIQRVRAGNRLQQGTAQAIRVTAVLFDYGIKQKVLANRLSEPELLWIYAEVQDFMGRHWADLGAQRL